jgi:Flp pilus assembly protein CpaB
MEATHNRSPLESARRFLGTRRGAMTAAAASAAAAGILLLAFVSHYRDSVNSGTRETSVLVANQLIPKGTAGTVVASENFFRPNRITENDAKSGAIGDASVLSDKVATRDIYPGQQLTADDFASGGVDPLRAKITGAQRAISIPVDASHALAGDIRTGDHVDVFGGFNAQGSTGTGSPVLRTLMQDILVLKAPKADASGAIASGKTVTAVLRMDGEQAQKLAFASDNGKVWIVLRPPAGAKNSPPSVTTLQTELLGTSPIANAKAGR